MGANVAGQPASLPYAHSRPPRECPPIFALPRNDVLSKVLDALRTSEAASQPEKATDQNARRLYTQECTKWVGAVSLILRKSFEQRETIDKTDVDAVVTKTQVPGSAGEQEKLQVKVVVPPTGTDLAKVLRTSITQFATDEAKAQFIQEFQQMMRALGLDYFQSEEGEKKLKAFMPARVLHAWQDGIRGHIPRRRDGPHTSALPGPSGWCLFSFFSVMPTSVSPHSRTLNLKGLEFLARAFSLF